MSQPRVLMVTGAYIPEISGGGMQTRALIHALRKSIGFTVLTTTAGVNESANVDGVPVFRVHVTPASEKSLAAALARMLRLLARLRRSFDILHLQGYSRKNIVLSAAARLFGKRILLTLHTGSHDDVTAIKRESRLGFWSVAQAGRVVAVSPGLVETASAAGIPGTKLQVIPNGIDVTRFHPITKDEQMALRRRLALAPDQTIILSVGFFSEEKGQQRLFDAWAALPPEIRSTTRLVFVGQTSLPHPEVDPRIATTIRRQAEAIGAHPLFVERTLEIERFYQAADVFVLPSSREGCPVALLEAMACGLPVIATRLPGSTDAIVTDGVDGRLVQPGDVDELRDTLLDVLSHGCQARSMGEDAHRTIAGRFTLTHTAQAYEAIYRTIL